VVRVLPGRRANTPAQRRHHGCRRSPSRTARPPATRTAPAPGCAARPPIFPFGFLSECAIGTDSPRGARRQFHLVDDDGLACIVYEQLHCFDDATASLVDRASLRVTAAQSAH